MIRIDEGSRMPPVANEIRDRILEACPGVSLIVLFGSRARGDATTDSDYDVLVVAPPDEPTNARAARLRLALWEVPATFDIMVFTPEELDAVKGFRSGMVHRALEEGVVLHAAA